jgi:cytochrome c-type biogenesis protein CcsB
VPVNQSLAQVSDNLVYSAIVVYALAMLALAGEWAFGRRSWVGRSAELIGAGVPARGVVADGGASAGQPSSGPPAAAPVISRAVRLGRVGISLTLLGFGLHLLAVLTRGLAVGRVPWGNMYEFSTASALAVMAVFLLLMTRYDVRWLAMFVVGPVLLTLGLAATVLYAEAAQLQPALQSYWLVIHVVAAVVASGAFTVGAALSALYMLRHRAEGAGAAPSARSPSVRSPSLLSSILLSRLPASAVLDRLAYRVHAFSFPIWTFAVIAGAIWAENAWGRYWGWDPKETWAFITWVVYAAYLHARATAGWHGTRVAIIALLGYASFLFNYFGVNIWITGLHSYAGL